MKIIWQIYCWNFYRNTIEAAWKWQNFPWNLNEILSKFYRISIEFLLNFYGMSVISVELLWNFFGNPMEPLKKSQKCNRHIISIELLRISIEIPWNFCHFQWISVSFPINFYRICREITMEFLQNSYGISMEFFSHFQWISIEVLWKFPQYLKWISYPLQENFIEISIAVSWKRTLHRFYGISMEWASTPIF